MKKGSTRFHAFVVDTIGTEPFSFVSEVSMNPCIFRETKFRDRKFPDRTLQEGTFRDQKIPGIPICHGI